MPLTMYQAAVPPMVRTLSNLGAILDKAAAYATEKKIDPSVLLGSRLYPDMLPLLRQVQIATDHAKGCAARLAGQEPPKYDDTEASFAELTERIARTVAFLETFRPDQFDGAEERTITLPMRDRTLTFQGMPYLLQFALPNFYFHVTTAYGILRHSGLEIGKRDFIGKVT